MLSQTTEYALRASAYLALAQALHGPEYLTPTPELAKHTRVPPNYLAKVLQQLAASDLIAGRRGVGGGYRLARPARDVKLIEVVRTVGSLHRIETCPLGLANHGPNLCSLHKVIDQAIQAAIVVFADTNLADLITPHMNKPLCDTEMTAKLTVSARGGA